MSNYLEVIDVDSHTSVGLTDTNKIEIRNGTPHNHVAVGVSDVNALRSALARMDLIRAEYAAKAERQSQAREPIDNATRQAIFAALREVYGRELNADERLEIVSKLADKDIHSMSRRGNMRMADAHRVLDALSTLRDFR